MKEVDIMSKVVGRDTSGKTAMYIPGAGAPSVNLDDYLLKKIWDSVFEIRTDSEGNPYLFEKMPFVTQYGITMYTDGGELDLPSIYAGIPFDNKTIWLNPETGLVEVLVGTGGGSGEGVSNFWDLNNIPSWITTTKPKYNYSEIEGTPDLSGYATETYVEDRIDDLINGAPAAYDTLKEIAAVLAGNVNSIGDIITTLGTKANKATTLAGYGITDAYTKSAVDTLLGNYVTLGTAQTITGEKDFTGGLKVNGSPIVYDATNEYWKLEGDLLVTGGITMYANEGTYTPSTIMDALLLDSATLGINDEGRLYVKGGTGGGLTEVYWDDVKAKPTFATVATSGKYSDLSGVPTLLSSFTDDVVAGKYLPLSGGTLTNSTIGLTINRTNNETPWLLFQKQGANVGRLGMQTDAPIFYDITSNASRKIWHEGNLTPSNYLLASSYTASDVLTKLKTVDGSGSGLDADLLDGLQGNSYWKAITEYSNGSNGADTTTSPNFLGYASGLSGFRYFLTTFYGSQSTSANRSQIALGYDSQSMAIRRYYNGAWYDWATIAFTTSNVASATKLNTARTIWGQSFDGTGNVNGNLKFGGNYCIQNSLGESVFHAYNNYTIVGCDNCPNKKDTYIDGYKLHLRTGESWKDRLFIDETGNVGLGVESPSYKLHVNGNGYFSSTVYFGNSTSYYLGSAGNLVCKNLTASGTASITDSLAVNGKIKIAGTDAATALLEFSRDGYNYITFPNTLSIGTSTAAADRQLIIDSTNATFQCNIIPTTYGTYSLGAKGNFFNSGFVNLLYSGVTTNSLWLVGGNSTDYLGVVIGRNDSGTTSGAEICRFNANGMVWASGVYGDIRTTDTNIYLRRAGLNTNTVILADGFFSPYSEATDLLQLGRPTARWKGVYLGISTTAYNNENGVTFCDSSGNGVSRISQATNMGIISSGAIYLRPASTKGTSGTITVSSIGATIDTSGNMLVTGGITMYSDIRKKTKLQDVELSLKQIADAPLIEHYYNSDSNKTTHVGSIAQYWAGLNDWFCKLDSEGFYTMEIQNAALASAISIARELSRYESRTDKEIRLLKDEVKRLKKKN